MDGPKNSHDIPRPRLFETVSPHAPCEAGSDVGGPVSASPMRLSTWALQLQDGRSSRCTAFYPEGWRWAAPFSIDELGSFVSPLHSSAVVSVRMYEVAWELDPLAWLMHDCVSRGLSVTMAYPHSEPSSFRFELGGIRDTDGAVWRAVAVRHGVRFLTLETLAPASCWDSHCEVFRACRERFEVLPVPRASTVEPQRIYRMAEIAFAMPRSWSCASDEPGPRFDRLVFSASETGCRGLVIVDSGKGTSPLQHRQSRILSALERLGWSSIGGLSMQSAGIRSFGGVLEGELASQGEFFSLRIAHRRIGGAYVDYATVAPNHDRLAIDAMRTMKAVEIAIDSTRAHLELEQETAIVRSRAEVLRS